MRGRSRSDPERRLIDDTGPDLHRRTAIPRDEGDDEGDGRVGQKRKLRKKCTMGSDEESREAHQISESYILSPCRFRTGESAPGSIVLTQTAVRLMGTLHIDITWYATLVRVVRPRNHCT
jgi:hypothetical protein